MKEIEWGLLNWQAKKLDYWFNLWAMQSLYALEAISFTLSWPVLLCSEKYEGVEKILCGKVEIKNKNHLSDETG